MIRSNRTYDQYRKLGEKFGAAKKHLDAEDYENAVEALKELYTQSVMMWGPAPIETSEVGSLLKDVKNGRMDPPYGDFLERLEERREAFRVEYGRDVKRANAFNKEFVPKDEPDPPEFLRGEE